MHVLVEMTENVAERPVVRDDVHSVAAFRARPAEARGACAFPYELCEVPNLSSNVRRLALQSPVETVVLNLLVPAGGGVHTCIHSRF